MGYSSVVVSVIALSALASAAPTIGDNSLDGGERVVLVSPVLAPPRDSRAHDTTRSRQFPILILLAQPYPSQYGRPEPEAKSLKEDPQPIYVKKLEDQEQPETLNRQKRTLHKKKHHGGGYGGGYQQPTKVIVYEVQRPVYSHGGGYGGHGGHGGGQQGGYGGGGNYGGGYSFASASAQSSSGSYGKR